MSADAIGRPLDPAVARMDVGGYGAVPAERTDVHVPLRLAEIAAAGAFLRLLTPMKVGTRSPSSYKLKHMAEAWSRARGGVPGIANGALVAAAVALGLDVSREHRVSPNLLVGVDPASVRRVMRKVEEADHV